MITFTGTHLICDCGNKDQKKFVKFIGSRNIPGIRKRIITVKYEAVICNECDQIIDDQELAKQIDTLNKINHVEEEGRKAEKALQNQT